MRHHYAEKNQTCQTDSETLVLTQYRVSLVHSWKEGMKWWAQQHEKASRPQKITKGMITEFFPWWWKPFTTFGQVKKTLQEEVVSLSKSTIKRHRHWFEYRGFGTRCKPLVIVKSRKARLDFAQKHLKNPEQFWNSDPKHSCLLIIWLLIEAAGRNLKCIELYYLLIGWCFTVQMDSDQKHTENRTQKLLKAKSLNILQKPVTWPQPNWAYFLHTEDKTKGRKTNEQEETAIKAWQSISRKETQHLVMSMGSRLQAVIDCRGFLSKYWNRSIYL